MVGTIIESRKQRVNKELAAMSTSKRFNCNVCTKTYSTKFALMVHVKAHHADTLFSCINHCEKVYLTKKELDGHLSDVRRISMKLCEFCGMQYKRSQALRLHTLREHPQSAGGAASAECSSASNHDDSRSANVVCSVCDRSYKRRYWFNHQRSTYHMENLMREMNGRVRVFESSFSDRCTTYQIRPNVEDSDDELTDTKLLLQNARTVIVPLLERELITRGTMKFRMSVMTVHHRPADDVDVDEADENNFVESETKMS